MSGEERQLGRDGLDLVEECQAFLDGRYLDWLAAQHLGAPAWAVLNPIAHGRLDDLTALVADRTGEEEGVGEALVLISEEIAALVRGNKELFAFLQQKILVPLELTLMSDPPADLDLVVVVGIAREALRSASA